MTIDTDLSTFINDTDKYLFIHSRDPYATFENSIRTTVLVATVNALAAFAMDKHNLEQPMTYEINHPNPGVPGLNTAFPLESFAGALEALSNGAAA